MKKNYRFLSSIALTGMLATSIMGTTVNAATPSVDVVGVCSNVISGKMVPVVVKNGADSVTMTDIKNSGKFDIVSVVDANAPLKSGDKFKVKDGTEYTVVVYGDANKDGSVDTFDALYIQENAFNEFKGEEKVAADVARNSEVDTFDALRIQEYVGGVYTQVVDNPHTADSTTVVPPVVEGDCKVTFGEGTVSAINNVNKTDVKAKINIPTDKEFKEPVEDVSIQIEKKDGTYLKIATDKNGQKITIPANSSEVTVSLGDFTTRGGIASVFTTLDDGTLNGKIVQTVNGKEKILGTFTVEKNIAATSEPVATNVKTNRENDSYAKMSLQAKDNSDIVKMYYVVLPLKDDGTVDGTAPANVAAIISGVKAGTTKVATATNNKIEESMYLDTADVASAKAYKVYYVVENSCGSRSTTMGDAIITKNLSSVTTENKVKEVKAPVLEDEEDAITSAIYTWTLAKNAAPTAGQKFVFTLYRSDKVENNELVNPEVVEELTITGKTDAADLNSGDLKAKMEKAGHYQAKVVVKGDAKGTTRDSEEVKSEIKKVTQLNKVSNVTFKVAADEDGIRRKKMTWDSEYNKDDIKGYSIKLISIAADGTETDGATVTSTEKEVTFTDVQVADNKIYKAEVTVEAKDTPAQLATRNSDKFTTNEFFAIQPSALAVTSKTASGATAQIGNLGDLEKKVTEYEIQVYIAKSEGNPLFYGSYEPNPVQTIKVTPSELGKDKKVEITGLNEHTRYGYSLIARIGNVEGQTGLTSATTTYVMPAIEGLEVSKQIGTGKIVETSEGLNINGTLIKSTKYAEYPAELSKIADLIDTTGAANAALVEGDKITLNGQKLSITFANRADAASRNFTNKANGMTLELEELNKSEKWITTTAGEGNEPAEVILKGATSNFNIAGLNAKTITLKDNVLVYTGANQKVTVAANNTAVINNVSVKGTDNTIVTTPTAGAKTLNITPNNGENNLTFVNETEGNTTITFVGDSNVHGNSQSGEITITSKGGIFTVTATDVELQNNFKDVKVEKGTIVVDNTHLTGSKDIKVMSKKGDETIVNARIADITKKETFNNDADMATLMTNLNGKTVTFGTYDSDADAKLALRTALSLTSKTNGQYDVSDEDIALIQNYLSKFGIDGTGATIKFTSATKVTITFGATTEVNDYITIGNII